MTGPGGRDPGLTAEQIRAEYLRRRRRQVLGSALFLLAFAGIYVWQLALFDPRLAQASRASAGMLLVSGIVATLWFSWRNWRCPACRRHLGRTLSHRACPHCGVRFVP